MNYESMSLIEVINYINLELSKGRTMKDIEETDFNVSKGVITKRLNRKGYKKIDNKFISEFTLFALFSINSQCFN